MKEKTVTILVIGRQKVGKSTFSASCANYLSHESLEDALMNPIFLEDTSFSITEGINMKTVSVKKTVAFSQQNAHSIKFSQNGENTILNIIEQDAEKLDLVEIEALSQKKIHAVCFMMQAKSNADDCRFFANSRFSLELKALIVKLGLKAKDLFFFFTRTAPASFKPGDSLIILTKYLEKMKDAYGTPIKAEKQNIFCFENDCFRYICIKKCFPDHPYLDGTKFWNFSKSELKRMLESIEKNQKERTSIDIFDNLYLFNSADDEEELKNLSEQLENSDLNAFKEPFTILLLGEENSGKIAFINALYYYLNKNIVKDKKSEVLSQTSKCYSADEKSYTIKFGPGDCYSIKLVNIEGISVNSFEPNFFPSLSKDFPKKINGLFIFMKSVKDMADKKRCKQFLHEIFTNLHKTTNQYIRFCFTNSKDVNYEAGDQLDFLKETISARQIDMSIERKNVFLFENEVFHYLKERQTNATSDWQLLSDADYEKGQMELALQAASFKKSWKETAKEVFRLLNECKSAQPYGTGEILKVIKNRQNIIEIVDNLQKAKDLDLQVLQLKIKTNAKNDADKINKEKAPLLQQPTQIRTRMFYPRGCQPRIVCTAEKCIQIEIAYKGTQQLTQTIYKTICQNPSNLAGIVTQMLPNEAIKTANCFKNDINRCSNCSCSWDTHMQINYEDIQQERMEDDMELKEKIADCDRRLESVGSRAVEQTNEAENKFKMLNELKKLLPELALSLQSNALLSYNSAYQSYVEYLIEEEKRNGKSSCKENWPEVAASYERLAKAFDDVPGDCQSGNSSEEIDKAISQFKDEFFVFVDSINSLP